MLIEIQILSWDRHKNVAVYYFIGFTTAHVIDVSIHKS
jgi:hypothetical protein